KYLLYDTGVQISWTTVFMAEYAGPLAVYLFLYARPSFIYGADAASKPVAQVVNIAAACWSFHYVKRLLETMFVHRFSKGTMPIFNLFKNCSYYWGFGFLVGYFINHPLYTPPNLGLKMKVIAITDCSLFFFVIHTLLRDLRPPGSHERRIPYANSNPMTQLFRFVSCPNYTYEAIFFCWCRVTFPTLCVSIPAALFTLAGFYQMTVWALGKHRNYKKEFPDYPRRRRAIIPFFI
ncbi:predicted protein, partial [Nematostella vectensis]